MLYQFEDSSGSIKNKGRLSINRIAVNRTTYMYAVYPPSPIPKIPTVAAAAATPLFCLDCDTVEKLLLRLAKVYKTFVRRNSVRLDCIFILLALWVFRSTVAF